MQNTMTGDLTDRRMKIAVPSGYNNTPVDVLIVGQNSIEDFSDVKAVKMDYSIGKLVAFVYCADIWDQLHSSTSKRLFLGCVNSLSARMRDHATQDKAF